MPKTFKMRMEFKIEAVYLNVLYYRSCFAATRLS